MIIENKRNSFYFNKLNIVAYKANMNKATEECSEEIGRNACESHEVIDKWMDRCFNRLSTEDHNTIQKVEEKRTQSNQLETHSLSDNKGNLKSDEISDIDSLAESVTVINYGNFHGDCAYLDDFSEAKSSTTDASKHASVDKEPSSWNLLAKLKGNRKIKYMENSNQNTKKSPRQDKKDFLKDMRELTASPKKDEKLLEDWPH